MAPLTPFLIGGPAFSGTTLLTLLLDVDGVVCLDEPDFGKPEQEHRNIPLLRRRFPTLDFPDPARRPLTADEELAAIRTCADVLAPLSFGIKTCGPRFVEMAERFRAAGLRVAAIVRDPRDIMVRPLGFGLEEAGLVGRCRTVWNGRELYDGWVRYEDLVSAPRPTLDLVVDALGLNVVPSLEWDPGTVSGAMLKSARHDALRTGRITDDRVGLWRRQGLLPSEAVQSLAVDMGYPP